MTAPNERLRWGILSTAKIGMQQVTPALQRSRLGEVTAIASRSLDKAEQAAGQLGIAKAYGSYEELLADPEIDAVYNPLPNHLHVPLSIQALEAGKHVLCEKPIGLSAAEGQRLVDAGKAHPRLKLMEGFMYRHHPQWETIRGFLRDGAIGELRDVHARFSYFNNNADNIRNMAGIGGGGLMDIGCYGLSLARYVFDAEPLRVLGRVEIDPAFKVDRFVTAIVEFETGCATVSCGTQMAPHQGALLVGTTGTIAIEWPFTPPADGPTKLWIDRNGAGPEEIVVPACDKYIAQGDLFAEAVFNDGPVPTPIEDAVANMRAIEAVFRSGESGRWETV